MIKVFISHKKENSDIAIRIGEQLKRLNVPYYLDVLDANVTLNGRNLTKHIKQNLNDCTDIIVIMSELTKSSQWVPFEVGMAAQNDMPTATFLQDNIELPSFLEYWPRLKQPSDITKYIAARNEVRNEYQNNYTFSKAESRRQEVEKFYAVLKQRL